ncbi:MAG: cytochrome b/b6 domain-containing protein [Campylobacteraceae bacterium]|jgi:formate dehydrogenase subunit gamma|nr:cytochrome b/b6 domain-containing protein [Campylobacteraceae bacterium]
MREAKVLKFPISEKIFHNLNLISWIVLIITGALIYFKALSDEAAALAMDIHIVAAVVSTANFFGFAIINYDRFILLLKNLTHWDKDTLAWFKNLGGYPRKLFGINFGPKEVAPQGRFNGGQKILYPIFIVMIFALIISGWLLYALTPALGKQFTVFLFYFHVWGSIVITALVIFGHAPLAVINFSDFKAMFSSGEGYVPLEETKQSSPKWLENDLVKIEEDATDKHCRIKE